MQQSFDVCNYYFRELTNKVIAESGISTDGEHLGKIIIRCLKETPNFLAQIDGGTGETETNKSVLERTVMCSASFINFGLKYQDVVMVIAPNHLHISIPLYAAFCTGVVFAGIDFTLGENELADTFKSGQPKMIFCQNSNLQIVRKALARIKGNAEIITFDDGQYCMSFTKFISKYSGNTTVENFRICDFDPVETIGLLVATSGSTGLPKVAVLTHQNISVGFIQNGKGFSKVPHPFDIGLVISPIQWISSTFQIVMSPILRYTRLQTSTQLSTEHVYYLINKYKPKYTICSPTYLTTLLRSDQHHECDFTSFQYMLIGGSAVSKELYSDLKKVSPNVIIQVGYGMSEASGIVFSPYYVPLGSIGRPMEHVDWKLVNPETEEIILEPNKPGEIRLKGRSIFKGYYNNLEMTAQAFDEDGWLKSGDIVYRDENYNFFYVDRQKILLKYRNHQVSPLEIENVILKHPGVMAVAVSGIPHPEYGDLPVAFVVKKNGHDLTEQCVKNLVKESLTDSKQLRGGVIFMDDLPVTSTSKIDRTKLKNFAVNMAKWIRSRNAVNMHLQELSSRIVADSGIPTDRYHLGKLILQSLKDAPDYLSQIDGATGETENFESVLKRSVRCATALKNFGLKQGDVVVLMAPNHIHLCIPMYAAMYIGAIVAGIDMNLKINELKDSFNINKPRIIFCQTEKAADVNLALSSLNIDAKIVTFDKGSDYLNFHQFVDKYGDDTPVEEFKATNLDPNEAIALLISTSGTTGLPKSAAATHANFAISAANMCPNMWATLFKKGDRDKCDLSCFDHIMAAGSAIPSTLFDTINTVVPETVFIPAYGLSEISGIAFIYDSTNPRSVGRPAITHEIRLVSPQTKLDVMEPNVPGELFIKGPAVFKGYYNDAKSTEDSFSDDGWFKTGDMFKRDENWYFYFVERIKMLLIHKNYQVSPLEIENVIIKHPAVFEVAVTGVPHPEHGDLPVACVVKHKGSTVTAKEIKDMVEETLSEQKHLSGGVIFLDALPMTSTSKVNRSELAALARISERL
ncbi:unnamed protein product [Danaus chrysippus]|uniref:(African queen) hypothetical protein n=1 Tax=Danaus chrysippus TaxID=151541 RepID=A0A8J2VXW5_9NEOP|nr:unnamed protein product [Danaus chrysippus]